MSNKKIATEDLVRGAIDQLALELSVENLRADLPGDFDLSEAIDSFTVVELLMMTEAKVEQADGVYVGLADEKLFDARQTPLCSLNSWIQYVDRRREDG